MLRALDLADMEPIRLWRNDVLDILRTPFPLTKEQQEEWYKTEVCDRRSRSRFWAIVNTEYEHNAIETVKEDRIIGYGGIENIHWENRIGEISLLVSPGARGKKYGTLAANSILHEAFDRLNLKTVYAECYSNNRSVDFWRRIMVDGWNGTETILPNRKYCGGKYYDAYYFSVSV
jgi:RimJ/RimL family protein N-acetyltransferase